MDNNMPAATTEMMTMMTMIMKDNIDYDNNLTMTYHSTTNIPNITQ